MSMNKIISITDHITNKYIERKFGSNLSEDLNYDSYILLVWHEIIDAKFLDKFKNLKYIVRYGVGYDNIDVEECRIEV